ncbi:MAG: AI-2E family transporter, partial [Alphaproteobacteria bacterium]|nr:AI-2E family transporter [Alphaproteobacteria bacterium]
PRWLGSIMVLLSFGSVAVAIITLVAPLISSQLGALVDATPGYIAKLRSHYTPWIEEWLQRFQPADVEKLRSAAGQSAGEAAGWLAKLFHNIITGGIALIDAFALAIIAPVVAFFTLRDWPTLTASIDSIFPRRYYGLIREQLADIDSTLSGFIRGQALVCLALGIIYSTGLTAIGLKYSLAIGVTSGVLSFIPYIGTAFGWISSIILALVQFDDMLHVGLVVVVFYVGHFLEAYVLTPKLVGHRVGLHPLWILFALICGAKLLGFTGLLIAVPTAAVIGVLIRFAIRAYKDSPMYKN